jgi:hypothetical protein
LGFGMIGQPVKFVYHNGYWDGPLSGVCEIEGRRLYFSCVNDYHDDIDCRIFKVYDLSNEEWVEEAFWNKLFVENVGDHCYYDASGRRTGSVRPQALHDNFYKHPDYPKRRGWKAEDKPILGYFDRLEMKLRETKFRDYFIDGERLICAHAKHCEDFDTVVWRDDAQFYDFEASPSGKRPGWAISHDGDGDQIGAVFCPKCGKKLPLTFKELRESILGSV